MTAAGIGRRPARPGRPARAARLMLAAALAGAAVLATLALGACRRPPPGPPGKVVLVGLDAATWRLMRPLARRGALPAAEALMRGGAAGSLATLEPTVSVVIWTTVATGKLPAKHGIFNWTRGSESTLGGQLAITSNLRRCAALWTIASAAGRSSLIVNWWASWPAETIQGTMISNMVLRGEHPHATYPEELAGRVRNLPRPLPGAMLDPLGGTPGDPGPMAPAPFLGDRLADDQVLARASLELAREQRPDLLAVYFRSIDLLQHEYWDRVEPELFERPPPDDDPGLRAIIPRYYRYYDRFLDEVAAAADDRTTLALVSDHGVEPVRELPPAIEGLDLDALLAAAGLLVESAPGQVDQAASRAKDAGRYPPGLQRSLFIFAAPGENPNDARRQVSDALTAISTPHGRSLFEMIAPGAIDGEDLELVISPAIRPDDELQIAGTPRPARDFIRWIMHPRAGQHWHAPPGVILVAGPEVRRGVRLSGASVLDVAPTLLWAMDLELGLDMDGGLAEPILEPAALAARPPRWVGSHDGETAAGAASPLASDRDDEIMGELRSLGYMH